MNEKCAQIIFINEIRNVFVVRTSRRTSSRNKSENCKFRFFFAATGRTESENKYVNDVLLTASKNRLLFRLFQFHRFVNN